MNCSQEVLQTSAGHSSLTLPIETYEVGTCGVKLYNMHIRMSPVRSITVLNTNRTVVHKQLSSGLLS